MEVVESQSLEPNTKFCINAGGYEKSPRKVLDGCVYMGTKAGGENKGQYLNDILIPESEVGFGDVHLLIQYKKNSKSYYIKDNGHGTGTFIKIEKPLQLMQGFIISFADSNMAITIGREDTIELKFLDGPKADKKLYPQLIKKAVVYTKKMMEK